MEGLLSPDIGGDVAQNGLDHTDAIQKYGNAGNLDVDNRAVQAHKPDRPRDPARERAIAEAMARRAPELGVERLERIVHTIITESLGLS